MGVEECLVLGDQTTSARERDLGKINKEMEVWYDFTSLFLLGQQKGIGIAYCALSGVSFFFEKKEVCFCKLIYDCFAR